MLRVATEQTVLEVMCSAAPLQYCPASPLVGLLGQLASVLSHTTDEQYCRKPVGPVASSLGGHVRHCLDHIERLLVGISEGCINYELRARDTNVERYRLAAIEEIDRLQAALIERGRFDMRKKLRLTTLLSADAEAVEVSTTVGRELAFVISHTVHHQALIAAMLKLLGIEPPVHFGDAPATIAHLRQHPCAH